MPPRPGPTSCMLYVSLLAVGCMQDAGASSWPPPPPKHSETPPPDGSKPQDGSQPSSLPEAATVDSSADSPSDSSDGVADAPLSEASAALADSADEAEADAIHDAYPESTGPLCPSDMSWVEDGAFCMDRWEAQLEERVAGIWKPHSPFENVDQVQAYRAVSHPGVIPQAYVSGVQAQQACQNAGKRLCSADEFRIACRGAQHTTYPYGNNYQHGVCNEGRAVHPVVELYGEEAGSEIWDYEHMNNPLINQQPDTLTPTGNKTGCVNELGIFDLVGNVHEWVDDPTGAFLGGYYVEAELNGHGCLYTTTAHSMAYHDYSTGFRCCKDSN